MKSKKPTRVVKDLLLPSGNLGKPRQPYIGRYQPPNYSTWSANPRPQWPQAPYPIVPQAGPPSRQVRRAEERAAVKGADSQYRVAARRAIYERHAREVAALKARIEEEIERAKEAEEEKVADETTT